ncbi:methylamine dehydrogenase light chain [Paracoccus cavernae]|uniref:Methylamine dehydrogenase light chain n=1 Tax=Paracoccus cavernae TaxID=1571207 RepID=A0ABT8DC44_9RHOB|nr:methylamine dehydrogenase light chain [Paracoccus cavernae]
MSRRVAGRTSRRSMIGKIGTVVAGVALVPLLPVDRRGRVSRANAAGAAAGSDPRAKFVPQDHDVQSCDYWRHCSIDGNVCDCSGGSLTNCPRAPSWLRPPGSPAATTRPTAKATSSPTAIAVATTFRVVAPASTPRASCRSTVRNSRTTSSGASARKMTR